MKEFLLAVAFTLVFSTGIFAEPSTSQNPITKEAELFGHIDTKGLEALINSHTYTIIADARTAAFYDGDLIPGAIWLPSNSSAEDIADAIPYEDSLIIVYCTGLQCPASKKLAKVLINLGYTNVIKYPDGIEGWVDAGLPIEHGEQDL